VSFVLGNPVRFNDPTGHDVGCAGEDASLCGPGYNLPLAPFEYIHLSQLNYNLPPNNHTSIESSSNNFSMNLVYTPDPNSTQPISFHLSPGTISTLSNIGSQMTTIGAVVAQGLTKGSKFSPVSPP
jgi:hypothetical protein